MTVCPDPALGSRPDPAPEDGRDVPCGAVVRSLSYRLPA